MSKPRARDLGIPFEGTPAENNAITDVPGVTVGYATIIEGESARTGVTIIHPRGRDDHDPVFAAWFPFNGNGEMTGSAWVEEGGFLEGPIGITNTHSVGIVRDTIIQWQVEHSRIFQGWSCPLVTETADGWLNDINAFFVKPEHVLDALVHGEVRFHRGRKCRRWNGDAVLRVQRRHRDIFAQAAPKNSAAGRSVRWPRRTSGGASS